MVADRMATAPDGLMTINLENKCTQLNNQVMTLVSGMFYEPSIFRGIDEDWMSGKSVNEVANKLADNYNQTRVDRITKAILNPLGFPSFEEYHQRQQKLNPSVSQEIHTRIAQFKIGVDLLLGGFDNQAHVFHIGEPGTSYCYDQPGYRCVGIGSKLADPAFAYFKYLPTIDEERAIIIGFEAKKRAECAIGVGVETDIWTISKEGISKLPNEKISILEEYYEEKKNLSEITERIKSKED